ncbi:hypothetical protein BJ965_001067 [Streptomyces luteogriseus]|uniref:Uncharacterized protein n=1 Tax=Streptomyces luteogriseus TaxID=68233 RepID=A0A7W7GHN7_9ACTN|nr:hypothetical protein [Streptomyces luteogriseus]MBB4711185.1 hypothetical protein [Streptomyces luteogriseus]
MTQHLPRTVTVPVLVTRSLEIEEPDWCAGRHGGHAESKVDVTHYGLEHAIGAGDFNLLRAMLAQAPFAERATTDVVLYVEQQDLTGSYTPDEVEELADALVEAAARLRALSRELAAILARGDQ